MSKHRRLSLDRSCHNNSIELNKMFNRTKPQNLNIDCNIYFKTILNYNINFLNMLLKNQLIVIIISIIFFLHTNSISNVDAYKSESTTSLNVDASNLENKIQPNITKLNMLTSLNYRNNSNSNYYKYNFTRQLPRVKIVSLTDTIPDTSQHNLNRIPSGMVTEYLNTFDTNNNSISIAENNKIQEQWQQQQQHENQQKTKSKFKLRTGNELWDSIITECYTYPTFSCLQKNVFTYLDKTLDISNINVTNRLMFIKNQVDYRKYTKEANQPYNMQQNYQQHNQNTKQIKNYIEKNNRIENDNDNSNANNHQFNEYEDESENEIPDESRGAESPIEEVTNALYDKSIKFAMTHDIELRMPEMMFNGATFKISPRSFEGNGAIVKLELIPKQEIEMRETGRIFKKKIQNFLKNKLLLSFIAIVLVIKLIKIKLFWLLPLVIGIGAAKKLLLKVLLFFFPALAHIFKLCHYYHSNFHQTKYYHHHHLINHHHTPLPPWANEYAVTLPNGPELIFTQPPKGVPHHEYGAPPHGAHELYDNWESSGPGLGSEYLADNIHRNGHAEKNYFKPKLEDEEDIRSWGLFNSLPGTTIPSPTSQSYKINPFIPKHQSKIRGGPNPVYVTPFKRVASSYKTPPQAINLVTAPVPNAAQIAAQYDPALHQHAVQRAQAKVKEALRIQNEQRIIAQQQKILSEEPFVQDGQPIMPKGYDPFYSPILDKMDKIFKQLGNNFDTDYCKERLVCSMYKNPSRYSPHSNFVSAELSRDPTELEKPSEINQSVMKFYRLVQAARDGQEQRDCLRLHPQCSINTE